MDTLKQVTWWMCLSVFLVHQIFEKILDLHWIWADSYLDNLLCMPILLGLLLFERRLLLKEASFCFSPLDTAIMVLLLGILYEEIFPRAFTGFFRDWWDYSCYFIGGFYFYFFVNTNRVKNTVKE